jgi:hypothetical protein
MENKYDEAKEVQRLRKIENFISAYQSEGNMATRKKIFINFLEIKTEEDD